MLARASLLTRLDARDRALFVRCARGATISRAHRAVWLVLTHAGGPTCSLLLAALPLLLGGAMIAIGRQALLTLCLSHLLVQLVKRSVGRPRPSRTIDHRAIIDEPDCFSFPSGHSAAAMSVAVVYACAFPALAAPILLVAALVGASRVFLGVHYPADVVAGQLIALGTYLAMPVL